MKKKLVWLWIFTLLTLLCKVDAVVLRTVKWKPGWDLDNRRTTVAGTRSIFDAIRLVNSYIRFAVGFVCFLFMIINWYKLITANGDEKKTKEATSALIWSAVWIAICLLAYILVNVAVKLFA